MGPLLSAEADVIDCQEFPYFPIFASKLGSLRSGASLCVTWHEIWGEYWYEYLGHKGIFGRTVERVSAVPPDYNLAVSELTRRDVLRLGVDEASLLPNGIDHSEIDAAPVADRDVDVLFIGRLIPEKGVDLLVDAVSDLQAEWPDVSCVLVGEGPEEDAIKTKVAVEGLSSSIELIPFREDYKEVLALMKAANVFALPSRREGFGITVLEALACGTPVATVNYPRNAATELVEDGVTGAVCEPTPTALATGIRRSQKGTKPADCRSVAANYDWDRIAEQAEELYIEMAS
jgi:glycosyltransferase involved in cell wall biosynthesis